MKNRDFSGTVTASLPRAILSGDRNIRWDAQNVLCGLGFGLALSLTYPTSSVAWTNAIHGEMGNLLFEDGSVEQLSSMGLQRAAGVPNQGDNGAHHFISP